MTIRPITLAATVLLALAVAGCVTTKEQQARLDRADRLHRNAPAWFKGHWENYLHKTAGHFGVLALDKHGRGSHFTYCTSHCHGFTAGTFSTEKNLWAIQTVQRCNKLVRENHPGVKPECAVYAVKSEIVWEHPLPWEQGYTDPSSKRDPTALADEARGDIASELNRHAPKWMQNGWRKYRSEAVGVGYFAIAPDGSAWGYQTCLQQPCSDSDLQRITIRNCEEYTTSECLIYAHGERVVWPHEFPWHVEPDTLKTYREGRGAIASAQHTIEPTVEKRTFSLSWVGSTDVYRGTMWFEQDHRQGSGRMFGSVMGHDCEGKFLLTAGNRGEWEVDCGDGWVSAMGEFTGKGHGLGATGTASTVRGAWWKSSSMRRAIERREASSGRAGRDGRRCRHRLGRRGLRHHQGDGAAVRPHRRSSQTCARDASVRVASVRRFSPSLRLCTRPRWKLGLQLLLPGVRLRGRRRPRIPCTPHVPARRHAGNQVRYLCARQAHRLAGAVPLAR